MTSSLSQHTPNLRIRLVNRRIASLPRSILALSAPIFSGALLVSSSSETSLYNPLALNPMHAAKRRTLSSHEKRSPGPAVVVMLISKLRSSFHPDHQALRRHRKKMWLLRAFPALSDFHKLRSMLMSRASWVAYVSSPRHT